MVQIFSTAMFLSSSDSSMDDKDEDASFIEAQSAMFRFLYGR